MTTQKLAEALRLAYEAMSGSTDKTLLPRAHRAVEQALAAHEAEQEQAGEAVVGEAGTMPGTSGFTMACFHANKVPIGTKLYTRPQQPLSDEQINLIISSSEVHEYHPGAVLELIRAIESAVAAAVANRCADLCAATGPIAADMYGDGAECISTADLCADAIRREFGEVSNG